MFWTDCFLLAFADFYALAGSVNGYADVHSEYAYFRVIFDAWNFDVFFEAKAKVSAYVECAFCEFVVNDWEDFL
jgi:hypothetical protein